MALSRPGDAPLFPPRFTSVESDSSKKRSQRRVLLSCTHCRERKVKVSHHSGLSRKLNCPLTRTLSAIGRSPAQRAAPVEILRVACSRLISAAITALSLNLTRFGICAVRIRGSKSSYCTFVRDSLAMRAMISVRPMGRAPNTRRMLPHREREVSARMRRLITYTSAPQNWPTLPLMYVFLHR